MSDSTKEKINKLKAKLARYCAYRERTRQEVITKARDLGLYSEETAQLLEWLEAENFINEERFARTYVRDKFYLNKWGKRKIITELQKRKISEYCIAAGLTEIDEQDYLQQLDTLFKKKKELVKGDSDFIKNQKAAAYLIGKGYEADLVWALIKN